MFLLLIVGHPTVETETDGSVDGLTEKCGADSIKKTAEPFTRIDILCDIHCICFFAFNFTVSHLFLNDLNSGLNGVYWESADSSGTSCGTSENEGFYLFHEIRHCKY